jgi:hypothetical protein
VSELRGITVLHNDMQLIGNHCWYLKNCCIRAHQISVQQRYFVAKRTLKIFLQGLSPGFRVLASVMDPDPYVFGPHGSGSISQRYGTGSGSFYHQEKIGGKTLIPTVL